MDGRSRLSCAPTADCAFKYQLGDWHLGRSCRLRTAEEKAAAAAADEKTDNKVVAAARAVAGKVFGGISAGKEVCVYVCVMAAKAPSGRGSRPLQHQIRS